MLNPDFSAALGTFVETTQVRLAKHYAENFSSLTPPVITSDVGQKYVRIVREDVGRSAFCFVRIADGAILKSDGWKRPAKHARGSIYVNAGQDAITEYGAHYLR